MKKKLNIIMVMLFALVLVISGCSKQETDTKTENTQNQQQEEKNDKKDDENTKKSSVNFVFKDGLPALSIAKMIDEKSIEGLNYDMVSTPDALTAKVLNGEADIAIVPSNFAAIAFNKNLGYKIAGVSSWGNTYIITDNKDIKSLKDLEGKTLTSFAKGMTPDIITKFVLEGNGVDLSKVNMEYLPSATEIAPTYMKSPNAVTVAPEPIAVMIQMKKEGSTAICDLNRAVKKLGMDKGFPQSVLIIKSDLIENNKELVDTVIENYISSIKWAKQNKEGLAELSERLELKLPKAAIIKGFSEMNLGDMEKNSKDMYEKFFETLFKENPKSIGGKVPTDDAYYER